MMAFPESAAFGKKIPLAQLKEKGASAKFLKWVKAVKWAYIEKVEGIDIR